MTRAKTALSANEAASVTGVPLKRVHRIVDAGLLDGAVETRAGTRLIVGGRGLVGLKLAYQTADLLTPKGRRWLLRQVLQRPQARKIEDNAITVDVAPIQGAILRKLSALKKARKMVAIHRDILGGAPCFKGTRIPVHDIAAMRTNGDEKSALLKAYPRLTSEQVDLAVLYAEAYPRRGRPRSIASWKKKGKLISSETIALRDLLQKS